LVDKNGNTVIRKIDRQTARQRERERERKGGRWREGS
jgi:hypothetical protein